MSTELFVALYSALLVVIGFVARSWIRGLTARVDIHDCAIRQIRDDCAHHLADEAALREMIAALKDNVDYIRARVDEIARARR